MESDATKHPILTKMVQDLTAALGSRLRGVVLYGSAARGDFQRTTSDFNLLLLLEDLEPETLEALAPALRRWRKVGQPAPRLFSPTVITDAADVFPIEFLDIRGSHRVLHGEDPMAGLEIRRDHLRLQCERELREKMMRLREGYIEAHRRSKDLERLLTDSYTTFVALFRGCLHLLGGETPVRNQEVVREFCERAGLDRSPFDEVDRLKRGESIATGARDLFACYYEQLTRAVRQVDRFDAGGNAP